MAALEVQLCTHMSNGVLRKLAYCRGRSTVMEPKTYLSSGISGTARWLESTAKGQSCRGTNA